LFASVIYLIHSFDLNFKDFLFFKTDLSTGKSMTYGALIESINFIGNALQKRGFRPSDTLFFIANNHLEMAIAYLAVWFIGGCSVSLGVSCFSGLKNLLLLVEKYVNEIFYYHFLLLPNDIKYS